MAGSPLPALVNLFFIKGIVGLRWVIAIKLIASMNNSDRGSRKKYLAKYRPFQFNIIIAHLLFTSLLALVNPLYTCKKGLVYLVAYLCFVQKQSRRRTSQATQAYSAPCLFFSKPYRDKPVLHITGGQLVSAICPKKQTIPHQNPLLLPPCTLLTPSKKISSSFCTLLFRDPDRFPTSTQTEHWYSVAKRLAIRI